MEIPFAISHLHLRAQQGHTLPTERMVQQLEQRIGASLPADYREFLQKHGGSLAEFTAPLSEPTPWGLRFSQTRFHSLFEGTGDPGDIRWCLTSQIVPRNMILIASGDFGQATVLSFAGIDKGTVYFLDEHQMAFADECHMYYKNFETVRDYLKLRDNDELALKPPGYDNCYHSADSFSTFLEICKPTAGQ